MARGASGGSRAHRRLPAPGTGSARGLRNDAVRAAARAARAGGGATLRLAAGRRLTLYVRTEASRNRETAFRYARENNVGVFYWIDREVGYACASADLSKDELLHIANLVYKQLEP